MARRASSDRGPRPPREPEAAPEGPACVYGVRPVEELLEGEPERVVRVHFAQGHHGPALGRLLATVKARRAPFAFEPRSRLDTLAGGARHQGVVAEVAAVPYADLETVIARALADPPGLIVVLDGIEDPHNLGAVIRTAEAAGCHGMIVPKRHAAPLTGVAAKASAGASLLLPLARVENTARALQVLKDRGFWVYGLDAAAETTVSGPDYKAPVALVVGAEGKGLRPLVARGCDQLVRIPLKGRTASLNVSAAAAVGIFAVRARREGWGGNSIVGSGGPG